MREQDGFSVSGVRTAKDAFDTLPETPVRVVLAAGMLGVNMGTALAPKMKHKPDVSIIHSLSCQST